MREEFVALVRRFGNAVSNGETALCEEAALIEAFECAQMIGSDNVVISRADLAYLMRIAARHFGLDLVVKP